MILAIDLGTSVTKLSVWEPDGIRAMSRAQLVTRHAPGGRAEQDPELWWESVVRAGKDLRLEPGHTGSPAGSGPGELAASVEAVVFSAARQSFVPVDADLRPIGPGLLWSDRRAAEEAKSLCATFGGAEELRRRTGIYHDAGSVPAKLAWLARHEPQRIKRARWFLSPRDLVVHGLTGEVLTDFTLASASGLYEASGAVAADLLRWALSSEGRAPTGVDLEVQELLPDVVAPSCVAGILLAEPARILGLRAGIPVVIGAGDRACEVLGSDASAEVPMVSWGTTANVSVPATLRPEQIAPGMIATRGALEGWILEGGLSAAGSLIDWIATTTATRPSELMEGARSSPAGANGLIVLPWLGGARAPWWRAEARAAVLGLSADHSPADIARAALEGVAYDLLRCIDSVFAGRPAPRGLVLGGAGSTMGAWRDVLSAVSGLPARSRRSGEAASAGAALVAAGALGLPFDIDQMDPVAATTEVDASLAQHYRSAREQADAVASAVLGALREP